MNDRERHDLRPDREMREGSLGLRAPIMLRRHFDWPETVRFDPRFSATIHVVAAQVASHVKQPGKAPL